MDALSAMLAGSAVQGQTAAAASGRGAATPKRAQAERGVRGKGKGKGKTRSSGDMAAGAGASDATAEAAESKATSHDSGKGAHGAGKGTARASAGSPSKASRGSSARPVQRDYDTSGGVRCSICNRRAEFVGPTRGFDFKRGMCGGCVELSGEESGDNDDVPDIDWSNSYLSDSDGSIRCEICNRRAEFVGRTRGFDYDSRICGGCG